MVAARDKYLRETTPAGLKGDALEDAIAHKRSRMVVLATSMTHSSTKKAAIILGPVLAAALDSCRARGLEPFFLAATLGTTDTCAVDDFEGISSSLADFVPAGSPGEVWVHIDAAYAGAALVCPEVQEATKISLIDRFHSFDMNMHKWLLTNFDASCLFVRDREWFTRALTINQAVYSNTASDGGLVTDYREWQIPLGRRFRSLKIWFVMRSYGVKGLQAYIRRTTQLGEDFANWLRARPELFEILTGPSFALTVFRMVGGNTEESNVRTRKLCERVNATGKMWVTSTLLDGRFAIRMMTGVRTTEKEHVEAAFQTLAEIAEDVVKGT
ncbi:pyridoxal phosphate-dependent transferase [Lasiosphaeria hispida]|uniref:Pyridoxal phosphate-dependent transferase n=1 Tax=Lasiosphaeria hispida TaxID=260671 RepID=A0AAJ0M7J6_9PEZI|nr:pyridoxal phosphate-dependent transferase [Lasiosphaeria hispida]KAK3352976.1 pyridoxal phosphate-dependent transferase [Lasiosphaeria hispida]